VIFFVVGDASLKHQQRQTISHQGMRN